MAHLTRKRKERLHITKMCLQVSNMDMVVEYGNNFGRGKKEGERVSLHPIIGIWNYPTNDMLFL